jgi:hypothetical protein
LTNKFSHARSTMRNVTPLIEERRLKYTPKAKRKAKFLDGLFNGENESPSTYSNELDTTYGSPNDFNRSTSENINLTSSSLTNDNDNNRSPIVGTTRPTKRNVMANLDQNKIKNLSSPTSSKPLYQLNKKPLLELKQFNIDSEAAYVKNLAKFRSALTDAEITTQVLVARAHEKKICEATGLTYTEPSEITEPDKLRAIEQLVFAAKDSLMYTPDLCRRAAEIIKKNTGTLDTSDIDIFLNTEIDLT